MLHEEEERTFLDMPTARATAQWREFSGAEVLVVFFGPHAYVSPRWYEEKERVPTWNYAAVHAYGVPELIEDRKAKQASQRRLIERLGPQGLAPLHAPRRGVTARAARAHRPVRHPRTAPA